MVNISLPDGSVRSFDKPVSGSEIAASIGPGLAKAALVIPEDFTDRIESSRPVPVQFIVDGTDSNTATIAIGYAEAIARMYSQAISLDALFTEMARRSGNNMGRYPDAADRYMRLALKAQAACRATLEALTSLHQPREQTVKHVHVNEGGQAVVFHVKEKAANHRHLAINGSSRVNSLTCLLNACFTYIRA